MAVLELLNFGISCLWILVLILAVLYWYWTVPPNLPPGSAGLPIVGYLPFVSHPPHIAFNKLAKKYGPIFHLYLGNRLVVILNDYQAVKEAYIKQADVFSGRIRDGNFFRHDEERHGVVNGDGEPWKQQRRFVLTNLRDNGVGKLSLEPLLLNEIRCFMSEMKKRCGKPTAMKNLLYSSIANNVHLLVTGNRYDYDHPTIQRMIRALYTFAEDGQPLALHTFLPWISRIPGANRFTRHEKRWEDMDELVSITRDIIDDTKRDRQAQYECFSDAYIVEMKNRQLNDDKSNSFSRNGLLHVSRDLLTAGSETSSRALLFGMIYLTNNQHVQRKVQQEIDNVIGREREPSYLDRSKTPYTVAMITELNRMVSLTPLGLPHRNTQETKVMGYTIPKDTMIFANLWGVNNDPKLWGDPENFRPERFIGPDGRLSVPEYFVPFSVGKRTCAGEPLARMELYLYFTSLLQNFEFFSADGSKLPLDSSDRVTRAPVHDLVCFRQRIIE